MKIQKERHYPLITPEEFEKNKIKSNIKFLYFKITEINKLSITSINNDSSLFLYQIQRIDLIS